uniref:hypothetical protein n=1 Tax=Cupriavidus taiwanensis TaxID=164546 RepID=UPI0011C067AC|nr:hypothetical protein [Cupriavidus taiwanensis]
MNLEHAWSFLPRPFSTVLSDGVLHAMRVEPGAPHAQCAGSVPGYLGLSRQAVQRSEKALGWHGGPPIRSAWR